MGLLYKDRNHPKTIELIKQVIHQAEFNSREGKGNHIGLNKDAMINYHLSYIIESLESNGYDVVVGEGKLVYNLYLNKKIELLEMTLDKRLEDIREYPRTICTFGDEGDREGYYYEVKDTDFEWLLDTIKRNSSEINLLKEEKDYYEKLFKTYYERYREVSQDNKELQNEISEHISFLDLTRRGWEDKWNFDALADEKEKYKEALNEIIRLHDKDWNKYGIAYSIAEKAILDND